MFGMGFMEILLILVVAVIALGPEKLPSAAVDIAKFFKKIKSGVDDAKSTLNNELNIASIKDEVDNVKSHLSVDRLASLNFDEPTKSDEKKKESKGEPKA